MSGINVSSQTKIWHKIVDNNNNKVKICKQKKLNVNATDLDSTTTTIFL